MTATPNASVTATGGKPEEPPRVASHSGGAVSEAFELGKTIVYALLIALALRVVLFQPFTIPSESMEPTLLKGDYIIVSKFAYGWSRHSIPFSPPIGHGRLFNRTPSRGDIIVFKLPRDGSTDYIQRLVGCRATGCRSSTATCGSTASRSRAKTCRRPRRRPPSAA